MHTALKRKREEAGIRRTHLATLIGCTERHLRSLENGQGQASTRLLLRLAQELGCSISELIDESVGQPKPDAKSTLSQ